MEIVLTYRGRIPAKRSDRESVWAMRREFHTQLEKLWGREPFDVLKRWEDSGFAAGAPRFTSSWRDQTFVPFLGRDLGVGADLEITLLSGHPRQKRVLSAGDLDNRVKRLVDALRVPHGDSEMAEALPPGGRWYCLLQDDDVVTAVSAKLGTYLASDDPSESFAFIRVRPTGLRVSTSNLGMLL